MADFWRLGVLLYELMVGVPPFYSKQRNENEIRCMIVDERTEIRFPPFVSAEGADLIRKLLHVHTDQRLGAVNDVEDVKSHPFFRDIDWSKLENRQLDSPSWVDESVRYLGGGGPWHRIDSQNLCSYKIISVDDAAWWKATIHEPW